MAKGPWLTHVEGLDMPLADEGTTFPIVDSPPYASAGDVPRSVRVLIAQAAIRRGVSALQLAEVYAMPIEWIEGFINACPADDIDADVTAHGTTLG